RLLRSINLLRVSESIARLIYSGSDALARGNRWRGAGVRAPQGSLRAEPAAREHRELHLRLHAVEERLGAFFGEKRRIIGAVESALPTEQCLEARPHDLLPLTQERQPDAREGGLAAGGDQLREAPGEGRLEAYVRPARHAGVAEDVADVIDPRALVEGARRPQPHVRQRRRPTRPTDRRGQLRLEPPIARGPEGGSSHGSRELRSDQRHVRPDSLAATSWGGWRALGQWGRCAALREDAVGCAPAALGRRRGSGKLEVGPLSPVL